MLLREKLEVYPFSNSERVVVTYILEQGRNISNKTSTQIAKETFTSKSTLVRIAKKINFSGWTELQRELLAEINYLDRSISSVDANYPFTKLDPIMTITNKVAVLEKESIDDTLSLVSHDSLQKAVRILATTKDIHVFAVSNNLLISQEFKHQMSRIKKNVHIHALQSETIFNALLAEETSCAIIISYSGETGILNKIASILSKKNIPIIAITNFADNTLSRKSDCVLRICTREKLYSKISTFSTDASIVYLLNVLYSCVFAENYDKNVSLKIESSKALENDRSSDSDILKE